MPIVSITCNRCFLGVPILAVFATELTHKSTGWRHESWWLIYGSGVYNIFVSCATMMFLVFILLYMGVLHKVHTLVEENVMKREAIETRYIGALEYFVKLGDSFISFSIFFPSQNTNIAPRCYRHMRHHRHGGILYFLHKFIICNFSLRICIFIFRSGEFLRKRYLYWLDNK